MRRAVIVGGGPAGLMAAECLAARPGIEVDVFDAMPSLGRKFLIAGVGGMNITHAEAMPDFIARYGVRAARIAPLLDDFGPQAVREWIHGLGIETFVGSSGRVFPREMKAAPLLRAWLHRLRGQGVRFHVRHRWQGWAAAGKLRFSTPAGEISHAADVTLLALGGGSWAKLGSDGRWVEVLAGQNIPLAPLRPANCGFDVAWSEHFRQRFAGHPVKPVIGECAGLRQQGEFNITAQGIEGGLVYALSAPLRDALEAGMPAHLVLDLAPGRSRERLQSELARPRGRDSLARHLRRCAGIEGVKAGLLYEFCPPPVFGDPVALAAAIKALSLPVRATRPLDEAISSAGGVRFEGLDDKLMVQTRPGLFLAGEMLDWEAPTGGYLLTACLASGYRAGNGAASWLSRQPA